MHKVTGDKPVTDTREVMATQTCEKYVNVTVRSKLSLYFVTVTDAPGDKGPAPLERGPDVPRPVLSPTVYPEANKGVGLPTPGGGRGGVEPVKVVGRELVLSFYVGYSFFLLPWLGR